MWYCINNKKKDQGTAAAKAPNDIFTIARETGCEEVVFYQPVKHKSLYLTRFMAMFTGMRNWRRLYRTVKPDSVVILQHPNENIVIANRRIPKYKQKKNLKFVALIHDLDSLRTAFASRNPDALNNRNNLADEVLLKKCDCIICQNDSMKQYLISRGFDAEKLVTLEIFDYLHSCNLPESRDLDRSIMVAGNLMAEKCGYLYSLIDTPRDYTIHLFGPYYVEGEGRKNVEYHGVVPSDELPGKLQGSFGLVWDGSEMETCAGSTGEYLRYNDPHKASLFLSSNLPVIIWKEAALAPMIEENRLGVTVNSLQEIGEVLDRITPEEYAEYFQNVTKMGERLRSGYYTQKAIEGAKSIVQP